MFWSFFAVKAVCFVRNEGRAVRGERHGEERLHPLCLAHRAIEIVALREVVLLRKLVFTERSVSSTTAS